MTEMQLIGESLRLMGIGMGIVFVFLLLLVALLRVMSWIALRLAPAEAAPPAAAVAVSATDDVVAVISAAVALWRARHRPLR